ncbi:hypothetical protein JCM14076_03080 [Methylosoma difficile]
MNPKSKILHPIPVTLLSGFLGSGKTTLLNRLLSHYPHSVVIINEFGATPIDPQLLRESLNKAFDKLRPNGN